MDAKSEISGIEKLRASGIRFQNEIEITQRRIDQLEPGNLKWWANSELGVCRAVFDNLTQSIQVLSGIDSYAKQYLNAGLMQFAKEFGCAVEVKIGGAALLEKVNQNIENCMVRMAQINRRIDNVE